MPKSWVGGMWVSADQGFQGRKAAQANFSPLTTGTGKWEAETHPSNSVLGKTW